MSIENPYKPSGEEMEKAEEMMTDEQRDESEERERLFQSEYNEDEEGIRNPDHSSLKSEEQKPKEELLEKKEGIPVKQFDTAKGSIYAYDEKGKTARFKTATGEQHERQDVTVFVDLAPDEESAFLHDIDEAKVYVVEELSDGAPKIIRDVSEIINQESIYLASIKDGRWIRKKKASVMPKEGFNIFDTRQFEKDGQIYTERHLGNKVVNIETMPLEKKEREDDGVHNKEEVSVEHSRKLIDAKNALKEVVENIRRDELDKESNSLSFDFIHGYEGDVNRYVFTKMKSYEDRGIANWGAFQVAEELDRIRKNLEKRTR